MKKYIKHNAPKERGVGRRKTKCMQCGRCGGHISKYGLEFCRHCFRELAPKIGFKKFN
ncbi:30S ribosomal protein S14 [Candidatus Woesearchaeota archaeon]|nr:30S ribosomal protein S14 [Candidatus Woesearchaeota archaeon]MBW2993914.1 30S ribosomal protein S14 [Candidatus Woesearchaeota archaeon]